MNVEIINTGSELMLGLVLNTHQQWLCRRISDLGLGVSRQTAVADDAEAIAGVAREALGRAPVVIVSGGLGPTRDDRTRECIAALTGRSLREHAAVAGAIEQYFSARGRPVPLSSRIQAQVPEGAIVFPNGNGTAPGLAMELNPNPVESGPSSAWLILLPGPPRELRPMFDEHVLPLLKGMVASREVACRILRTTGLGESFVEEAISGVMRPWTDAGLELGYCARPGEVDIRLLARGPEGAERIRRAEEAIRGRIGESIFGADAETLESVVVRRLASARKKLVLAESCTGGLTANRVTNVPGASEVFLCGLVTYSNESKRELLGVREETLREHGAVSQAAAVEMAEGARVRFGADYALSITGIAGPGGGTMEKPAGTVFIALASRAGTVARREVNPYDRETFKFITSQQALELLRRSLELAERAR